MKKKHAKSCATGGAMDASALLGLLGPTLGAVNPLLGVVPQLMQQYANQQKQNAVVVSATPGNYADGGPIEPSEVRKFTSDKLKAVQLDLKSKGLYKGKIDGIYGPLTEKAIAGYNRTAQGIQGPEFTVISSNKKDKLTTLAAIAKAEDEQDKAIYPIWEKSNKPNIVAGGYKADFIPNYNPLTNTINLPLDPMANIEKLAKAGNKKAKTLVEFAAADNEKMKSYDTDKLDKDFEDLKASYTKDSPVDPTSLIAELAHGYQRRTGRLTTERGVYD